MAGKKVKKYSIVKKTINVYKYIGATVATRVLTKAVDKVIYSDAETTTKGGATWVTVYTMDPTNLKGAVPIGWTEASGLKYVSGDAIVVGESKIEQAIKDVEGNLNDEALDRDIVTALINEAASNAASFDANTRLFGQPFQFSKNTDLRVTTTKLDLGRKYLETFVGEAPIVSILPGTSNFLPSLSKEEKEGILAIFEKASSGANGDNKTFLKDILAGENRYFDFMSDYTSYMKYVNLMCRMSSIYMGINKRKLPLENVLFNTYELFDWKNYKYTNVVDPSSKDGSKTIFEKVKDLKDQVTMENIVSELSDATVGAKNYVQFYVDPASSFQESSGNQTAQSSLASFFESAQGISKEMHFYRDMLDGSFLDAPLNAAGAVGNMIGDATGALTNAMSGGLLSKLFGASKTVINGGNVMFPEIWGDSSYQKSYTVNVNLVSPYGDKESVYLHVLVPLFHLMALALPRQITANGFGHPFLVRVTCKGWFNCEMGMVDSISIEKVQGSYTVNGVPTEIRVSMSIRDLYSDLMITPTTKPALFYSNRGLSNWLAVTSGVDVSKPAIMEKWEGIMMALTGSVTETTDIYAAIKERIRNITAPLIDF